MQLSARFLNSVGGVNSFCYATNAFLTEGDAVDIYFQLIDASLDKASAGFNPGGRRFMPNASSTLSLVLYNIDTAKTITRSASQPYSLDPSIWKVSILSTDRIRGTVDMKMTLTMPITGGSTIIRGYVPAALLIGLANPIV